MLAQKHRVIPQCLFMPRIFDVIRMGGLFPWHISPAPITSVFDATSKTSKVISGRQPRIRRLSYVNALHQDLTESVSCFKSNGDRDLNNPGKIL